MSLLKSAAVVGIFTTISRIFGYIRDMFLASFLGATPLADSFFVAWRFPNFFRQLSAEGALNNAFVPLFSGKLVASSKEEALKFASDVYSWLFFILSIFTILIVIFMPQIMPLLAYGFAKDSEQMKTAILLGRIMFPYLILISMVTLLGGVLQSIGKFAISSLVPIVLNVLMILSLLLPTTPAYALSYGVVFSGIIQLYIMIYALKKAGIKVSLSRPKKSLDLKILFSRMIPGIIGGCVQQIDSWINTIIATTISGAVSYLYYSDRIVQFPLALTGTALGMALLPTMSKFIKAQQHKEALDIQNRALEAAIFFTLPASIGLFMLAHNFVSIMFEHGAFTSQDSLATARALQVSALGLPAFVMVKIFLPSFFANGDTRTPVIRALICLVSDVVFALTLLPILGYISLALATTLTSWLNLLLLVHKLKSKKLYHMDDPLKKGLFKISVASIVMVLAILILDHVLSLYLPNTSKFIYLSKTLILTAISGMLYLGVAHIMGATIFIQKMWKRG